ncbi:ferredoxin--NADP reductase 2 [Striga asiatica]|uniref:Ferredoxin--NADP reductase 2 n=1 Tax=Striga asiatica TaxID=4170 RepID=A0A5A7QMQ7_STRAF|nr:ferredoxin--NADP reductase 2 [Striga asiatica]
MIDLRSAFLPLSGLETKPKKRLVSLLPNAQFINLLAALGHSRKWPGLLLLPTMPRLLSADLSVRQAVLETRCCKLLHPDCCWSALVRWQGCSTRREGSAFDSRAWSLQPSGTEALRRRFPALGCTISGAWNPPDWCCSPGNPVVEAWCSCRRMARGQSSEVKSRLAVAGGRRSELTGHRSSSRQKSAPIAICLLAVVRELWRERAGCERDGVGHNSTGRWSEETTAGGGSLDGGVVDLRVEVRFSEGTDRIKTDVKGERRDHAQIERFLLGLGVAWAIGPRIDWGLIGLGWRGGWLPHLQSRRKVEEDDEEDGR